MSDAGEGGELQETLRLLYEHENWPTHCLNLIASENAYSRSLLELLSSDLEQRYANYAHRDTSARSYRGTKYVGAIEALVEAQAQRLFAARHVELRPISGHIAGVGVLAGLARPGDRVLELSRSAGGHGLAARMIEAPLFRLDVGDLAFNATSFNIDVTRAVDQIGRLRPQFVVLGASTFLFPHPVRELSTAAHSVGGVVLYDASHVLGLIVGHSFQSPLDDGADVMFGSTHKTFPGPQGGFIASNNEELITRASIGVYPALVTNHHLARMPAMSVALAEMERWGDEYAAHVIDNARALGSALSEMGVAMVAADHGWTSSHTVLMMPPTERSAGAWTGALEDANIITSIARLPAELGSAGIRLGAQEVTRRGAGPDHAQRGLPMAVQPVQRQAQGRGQRDQRAGGQLSGGR